MGHPFKPEPLAALQARYPKAMEHVFDIKAILMSGAERPGQTRENIFDFDDGLRMLVSREIFKTDGTITLHVSASFEERTPINGQMREWIKTMTPEKTLEKFVALVVERFAELSQDKEPLHFLGISPGGNPQFLRHEAKAI